MKIASLQASVVFGDPMSNLRTLAEGMAEAAQRGALLLVAPETFLTGYVVSTRAEAEAIAISADDPVFEELQAEVERTGVGVVVGFAERTGEGRLRNSARIALPGNVRLTYAKTHIPCMGLDRFVVPGESLIQFEFIGVRFGVLICYDLRPPEATRTLALDGIDVLLLSTNWPEGAETSAEFICRARAAENRIYVATSNRIGTEHGFRFIGRSKIIDVEGRLLAEAQSDEPAVLVAEVDPAVARGKLRVVIPGEYETDILGCRRPELYRL